MTLRTDLAIVQVPPVPKFGDLLGMNIIQADPDFGTGDQMVRLTDGSVSKTKLGISHSMQTASSAQVGIWNTDDTLILPSSAGGGARFLFGFDPVNLQGNRLLPSTTFTNKTVFSSVDSHKMYTLVGSQVHELVYDPVSQSIKDTVLCDFAIVLPWNFKISYSSMFTQSQDDFTFAFCFSEGAQDTSFHLCVYRRGMGYRSLNTKTGQVCGQWGDCGQAKIFQAPTGVPEPTFPFLMHEASVTPNGAYVAIGPIGFNPLVWAVDTLNLQGMGSIGHNAKGMQHTYGGGAGGGQLMEVPYLNPIAPYRRVVPKDKLPGSLGQKFLQDRHFSFGRIDPNDASIVWSTCGGPVVSPLLSAWESEVIGYDIAAGVVYRACHTFNSNMSKEFNIRYAIGCPSQTGKFVAFGSDMMGTLGSNDGKPTVVGSNARGDVFVVRV